MFSIFIFEMVIITTRNYVGDHRTKFMKMTFSYKEEKDWDSAIDYQKNHLMLLRNLPLNNHMTLIFKIFLELLYICAKGGYVG